MKLFCKLLLIIALPFCAKAQDTVALKQQAKLVASAVVRGDYSSVIDKMYQPAVTAFGGKQKLLVLLNKTMGQMKAQGVSFQSAEVGSPGKFYRSGTETQCLLPEIITLKLPNGKMINHTNLLAIKKDGSTQWHFLDLNKNSLEHLHQIVPNLNKYIVIPEPIQPAFISN